MDFVDWGSWYPWAPIARGIRPRHPVLSSRATGSDLRFPLGWSAIGPAESLCGAVPEAISDSDWGSEGEFEIGRFGAPRGNRTPSIVSLHRPSMVPRHTCCNPKSLTASHHSGISLPLIEIVGNGSSQFLQHESSCSTQRLGWLCYNRRAEPVARGVLVFPCTQRRRMRYYRYRVVLVAA